MLLTLLVGGMPCLSADGVTSIAGEETWRTGWLTTKKYLI
jgi:hypothetical protein